MSAPTRDPRKIGPKPPFPEQKQNTPGTERTLKPEADHGETSYEGTGKLKDRVAIVTGGDSGIRRAVAIAFAKEGANAVISYLPEEEALAKIFVFLASDDASYVTGEVYGATGGRTPY